jgi:two-component system, cell cycle sensor histidine kinase and response regulator CckA
MTAMSEKPTYENLKQNVQLLQNECAELNRTIGLLRDSENKHRTFFENSLDAMFITTPNGQVLEANAAACGMFGYTEEELIRGGRNAVVDLDDKRLLPALKERERKGRFAGELNFKRKDGIKIPVEITSVIFKTKDGDERASIIVRDISERKRAEKALGDSEAFTRTVMDHLPIGLAVNSVDPAVDFLYMNDNFPRFYRTTRKALSDPNAFWDVVYEDPVFREEIKKRVLEDCASNDPARMHWEDVPITRQGKETVFINARNTPVPEKSLMISTVWDVTERKRTEDALLESETRYRSIFNFGADGIVIIDPDTATPVDFNQQACTQLGYTREEFGSLRISDIDLLEGPEEAKAHIQKIRNIGHDEFETVHRTKHGERRNVHVKAQYILVGGKPVYHCIWRDITEHKRAEAEKEKLQAQLLQAMKMEAVGHLAGGVAHDFNNLLTVIMGYSELLLQEVGKESPMHGQVEEIKRAGERAASLTQQLLAFSRKQIIEPKVVHLDHLVAEMHKMLGRLIGENIELQAITGKSLGSVKVDPGQFQQILMNLAVNARDAMPDGGKIVIETANVDLDEGYCGLHPYVKPGRFVKLSVSDTGHGMSEEVKAHIFEPFFTTKERGSGTGLGLATTYGAVLQAGGSIEVYSEVGIGTTFKIYLPRVEEEAAKPVNEDRPTDLPGGAETVLIVEDEGILRNLCVQILELLGYRVLQARNGTEAIAELQGYGDRINLLLTDVVMPGMNGSELATQLVLDHPEMKVLFTSGYTEDVISHHGVLAEGVSFIGKPYTPSALARKVREVLDKA